jgi:hypothetical protein
MRIRQHPPEHPKEADPHPPKKTRAPYPLIGVAGRRLPTTEDIQVLIAERVAITRGPAA